MVFSTLMSQLPAAEQSASTKSDDQLSERTVTVSTMAAQAARSVATQPSADTWAEAYTQSPPSTAQAEPSGSRAQGDPVLSPASSLPAHVLFMTAGMYVQFPTPSHAPLVPSRTACAHVSSSLTVQFLRCMSITRER